MLIAQLSDISVTTHDETFCSSMHQRLAKINEHLLHTMSNSQSRSLFPTGDMNVGIDDEPPVRFLFIVKPRESMMCYPRSQQTLAVVNGTRNIMI